MQVRINGYGAEIERISNGTTIAVQYDELKREEVRALVQDLEFDLPCSGSFDIDDTDEGEQVIILCVRTVTGVLKELERAHYTVQEDVGAQH